MKIIYFFLFYIVISSIIYSQITIHENDPEFINFNPEAGLPFSDAVRTGNLLFLSGEIGRIPGTLEVVPGGIAAETEQCLTNIKNKLEQMGSSMSDVVKCTVILTDIEEWPAMNEVYKTFFNENFPARTSFAGTGLALNARVEIECIAVIKE